MAEYLTLAQKKQIVETPWDPGCEWPTQKNKNLAMSFTKFEAFIQCPRKYNAVYLAKTAVDGGDRTALEWGNAVHTAMEHYVLGGVPLPKEMKQFQVAADSIMNACDKAYKERRMKVDIFGERQWAIGLDGRQREWFAKDVWVRGKADVGWASLKRLYLYDYKTGKGKYPKPEQLDLLALLAVAQPRLQDCGEVTGMLLFIETGVPVIHKTDVTAGDAWRKELAKWQLLSLKMLDYAERDYWPEQEGPLCGWCPDKTCPFNRSNNV